MIRPLNDYDRYRRVASMEGRAARASAAECDRVGALDAADKFRAEAEVMDRQVVRARGQAHLEDRLWRQSDPDGYEARVWLACEFARRQAQADRSEGQRRGRARSGAGMVM